MAERRVTVRKAQLPDQKDLTEHDEHCSMNPQTLAALGVGTRQQVRVTRVPPPAARGVFTVSEGRAEGTADIARLGLGGRRRLGTDEVFDADVSSVVVSDLPDDEAPQQGEFVERLADDGVQTQLIVVAPHGGRIEPHTDDQAVQVAAHFSADRVSTWLCRGFGDASEAWHITSDDLHPVSFPLLGRVIGRGFSHAVSFHGFTPTDVLVGGAAPASFRQEIADAISAATTGSGLTVRVAAPGEPFGGDDAANVVNRLTKGGANGVQIEQSPRAREEHGAAIADAVAGVYLRLLAGAGAEPGPQGDAPPDQAL